MKRPSLLSQIVALNLLMVTAGILVAIFAAGFDFSISHQRWEFLVLAMTMVLTFLLNTLLLRRRFEPLERLLAMMERVDLSRPGRRLDLDPRDDGPLDRHRAAGGDLQPHAGATRERAAAFGRAGAARAGGGAAARRA